LKLDRSPARTGTPKASHKVALRKWGYETDATSGPAPCRRDHASNDAERYGLTVPSEKESQTRAQLRVTSEAVIRRPVSPDQSFPDMTLVGDPAQSLVSFRDGLAPLARGHLPPYPSASASS
jgi:hypothetical protein